MISAIVITKNEENNIKECLEVLNWTDEVIVIDSLSIDKTRQIAQKMGAKVFSCSKQGFDARRNMGAQKASGDWLLYVDADERVTPELRAEITQKTKSLDSISGFQIPRLNVFFGRKMRHGGWYPDYQTRLIRKNSLSYWFGKIHESPKINGQIGFLKNHFIHNTHRSIAEGFEKSRAWTQMEAELFYKAGHPPVLIYHLVKAPLFEFCGRIFWKRGFMDGSVGWLEGLIQAYNKFLVYAQLWEKQQKI